MVPAHFLAREQNMNHAARLTLRTVDECIDVDEMMVDEPDCFERGTDGGQVSAADSHHELLLSP
jgi:hypothetical protein